jgi:hypothetical protein
MPRRSLRGSLEVIENSYDLLGYQQNSGPQRRKFGSSSDQFCAARRGGEGQANQNKILVAPKLARSLCVGVVSL